MKFYRYQIREYAVHDYDGELVASKEANPKVELEEFVMIRETAKGYWIAVDFLYKDMKQLQKWVSKTSKRRYAYPTKEEAMQNFITRTKRRAQILQHQLDSCKIALAISDTIINKKYEKH